MKSLFNQEKTWRLRVEIKDLEKYLPWIYTENQRHLEFVLLADIPPVGDSEVHQWTMTSPGGKRCKRPPLALDSNEVPYRVYKGASDVLMYLWKLMVIVWKKMMWCRAGGTFIPKENNAMGIGQFRSVFLKWKKKIFFSAVAKRLVSYLKLSSHKQESQDFPDVWNIVAWFGMKFMQQGQKTETTVWYFWILLMPLDLCHTVCCGRHSVTFRSLRRFLYSEDSIVLHLRQLL